MTIQPNIYRHDGAWCIGLGPQKCILANFPTKQAATAAAKTTDFSEWFGPDGTVKGVVCDKCGKTMSGGPWRFYCVTAYCPNTYIWPPAARCDSCGLVAPTVKVASPTMGQLYCEAGSNPRCPFGSEADRGAKP